MENRDHCRSCLLLPVDFFHLAAVYCTVPTRRQGLLLHISSSEQYTEWSLLFPPSTDIASTSSPLRHMALYSDSMLLPMISSTKRSVSSLLSGILL